MLYQLTNSIHSSDLLDVFDPFLCFDLDHDRDMFVGRLEVLCSVDSPHALSERTAKATPAAWWEATVGNDFFRLCCIGDLYNKHHIYIYFLEYLVIFRAIGSTHHRDEDASRASIERILDLPRGTGTCSRCRDAYERAWCAGAKSSDCLDGLCRARLKRGESMFTIDHHPRQVWTRLRDRSGVDHTW